MFQLELKLHHADFGLFRRASKSPVLHPQVEEKKTFWTFSVRAQGFQNLFGMPCVHKFLQKTYIHEVSKQLVTLNGAANLLDECVGWFLVQWCCSSPWALGQGTLADLGPQVH